MPNVRDFKEELRCFLRRTYLVLLKENEINVVVNFSSQLIFILTLFWGMVLYANEYETKEKSVKIT